MTNPFLCLFLLSCFFFFFFSPPFSYWLSDILYIYWILFVVPGVTMSSWGWQLSGMWRLWDGTLPTQSHMVACHHVMVYDKGKNFWIREKSLFLQHSIKHHEYQHISICFPAFSSLRMKNGVKVDKIPSLSKLHQASLSPVLNQSSPLVIKAWAKHQQGFYQFQATFLGWSSHFLSLRKLKLFKECAICSSQQLKRGSVGGEEPNFHKHLLTNPDGVHGPTLLPSFLLEFFLWPPLTPPSLSL